MVVGEERRSQRRICSRPIWRSVCLQLIYQSGQGGEALVSHLAYSSSTVFSFSVRTMVHFMQGIEQQTMPVFSLFSCLLSRWRGLHVAESLRSESAIGSITSSPY